MDDLSRIATTLSRLAEADAAIDWPGILATGLVTLIATGVTAAVSLLVLRREIVDRRSEWLADATRRCIDSIERYSEAVIADEEDVAKVTMRAIFVRAELQALSANRSREIEQALTSIIEIWEAVKASDDLAERLDGVTRVVTLLGNLALAKDLPGLVSASTLAARVPLGHNIADWTG